MDELFTLSGDDRPIELDRSGITLIAPGLSGSGTWNDARPAPPVPSPAGRTSSTAPWPKPDCKTVTR
jgi:hypothetical protein